MVAVVQERDNAVRLRVAHARVDAQRLQGIRPVAVGRLTEHAVDLTEGALLLDAGASERRIAALLVHVSPEADEELVCDGRGPRSRRVIPGCGRRRGAGERSADGGAAQPGGGASPCPPGSPRMHSRLPSAPS